MGILFLNYWLKVKTIAESIVGGLPCPTKNSFGLRSRPSTDKRPVCQRWECYRRSVLSLMVSNYDLITG